MTILFEQIATGGCQSYLVGCSESRSAILIDPELSQIDHYAALATREALRIRYLIDTHTHADHFSATRELAQRFEAPIVMYRTTPVTFANMRIGDGEMLVVGKMRVHVLSARKSERRMNPLLAPP